MSLIIYYLTSRARILVNNILTTSIARGRDRVSEIITSNYATRNAARPCMPPRSIAVCVLVSSCFILYLCFVSLCLSQPVSHHAHSIIQKRAAKKRSLLFRLKFCLRNYVQPVRRSSTVRSQESRMSQNKTHTGPPTMGPIVTHHCTPLNNTTLLAWNPDEMVRT